MTDSDPFEKLRRGRTVATGIAILLLLGLLIAVFFNRLAASSLILARGDTLLYFYPYWEAAAEALKAGRVPLWNPSLFMGVPFLANSQVGFLYPLNWPFWLALPTPYAVSFSIMTHLLLAGAGVYLMGRRCLTLNRPAALLAAILFSLGGYLTAQAEHINQVQGMAWLPWYFVVLCPWQPGHLVGRQAARVIVGLSAVLSLQLLTGHTQTVFISLMAVAIWLAATFVRERERNEARQGPARGLARFAHQLWSYLGPVFLGVFLSACVTAAQLWPTLELSRHSLRQGGLAVNEVLSFSLQPLLLGQSLLPAYDHLVFTEYVLALPVTALLLAFVGASSARREKRLWPYLLLAAVGLLLALGRYNPLYYLLARLPGFDLFRAPARWSVLYALAIALLAAAGWQVLSTRTRDGKARITKRETMALIAGLSVTLALIAWSIVSAAIAARIPTPAEASVATPTIMTIVFWIGEMILASAFIYVLIRGGRQPVMAKWAVLFAAVVMLFLGTRMLPYNNPTTPEAYFDQRTPISLLLADVECDDPAASCQAGAGRLLSLSDIFFDVGDQAEIDTIYEDQLGATARFDYTVAIKQKEILGPNLPLAYGLRSVDGFDGGILPLSSYATLMRLIIPEGAETNDGRLREHLDAIPEERWLDLFGARYIITDKIGDEWRNDVLFDMKHPTRIAQNGDPVTIGHVPSFEATEIWLIAEGPPGKLSVTSTHGDQWLLTPTTIEPGLWRATLPVPSVLEDMTLNACQMDSPAESCVEDWFVRALALVDSRDETFTPVVAGEYRLVHSGDVKIYENQDVMPPAQLVYDWRFVADHASGLEMMRGEGFDPRQSAVLLGNGPAAPGTGQGSVTVTRHDAERFELRSESSDTGLLLLTEAFFPGWQASVDGRPVDVVQTDILFRGVFVPAGVHEIVLEFRPVSFRVGQVISLLGVLAWIILFIYAYLWVPIRSRLAPGSNIHNW
ncbi:MAG: YfhO family protein [Chloroflexota bacterium]|nr:MAG: YfhO family protein [Chloroflexota bacterium]